MGSADNRKSRRRLVIGGLSILPLAIVALLPSLVDWGPAVPTVKRLGEEKSVAPEILADLSSDLISISVAIILGMAIVLREWRGRRFPVHLLAVAGTTFACAVGSAYAGFRFRFAIAEQIMAIPLDLEAIGDRLAVQAILLLFAVSGLVHSGLLALAESAPIPVMEPIKDATEREPPKRKRKS